MTLAKSCEPVGKPGQPKWTDPEVHRLVNPNQGLPGSRWKNAQFRIRPDLWWPVLWWFFATLVILVVILRRQVLGCIRQDSQTKECHLAKLGSPTHFEKQVGRGTFLHLATLTLVVTLPTTVCPLIFANSPTQNWCLQVIPFTTLNIHFFWQQCG